MTSVRRDTFETNSSSTHSISISNLENLEDMIQDLNFYSIESKDDLYGLLGKIEELKHYILESLENV